MSATQDKTLEESTMLDVFAREVRMMSDSELQEQSRIWTRQQGISRFLRESCLIANEEIGRRKLNRRAVS